MLPFLLSYGIDDSKLKRATGSADASVFAPAHQRRFPSDGVRKQEMLGKLWQALAEEIQMHNIALSGGIKELVIEYH